MIVFWSSDPDATYGFEGTAAARVGQGTRHQARAHRSVPQPHRGAPRRQVDRAEAGHRPGARPGALPRVDHRGALRQGVRGEQRTTGFDEWKAYILGETRRRAEDPRVAGGRDRRAGPRRARAGARVGHEEDLSRRRQLGRRRRRRLPRADGRAVGADDDHPRRDAGLRSPGLQLRQPAVRRRRSTSTSISPATATAASRATWRTAPTRPTTTSACRTS